MEKDTTTKPAGRPPIFDERMTRVTITLPDFYISLLKKAGDGNLSKGIRLVTKELYMLEFAKSS